MPVAVIVSGCDLSMGSGEDVNTAFWRMSVGLPVKICLVIARKFADSSCGTHVIAAAGNCE